MPYIKEDRRQYLDECINDMTKCLKLRDNMTNTEFAAILGDINYAFSRILGGLMDEASYPKIAMITGVLENIKQEYYRRVASPYEDKKIVQHGDIKEYKNVS